MIVTVITVITVIVALFVKEARAIKRRNAERRERDRLHGR